MLEFEVISIKTNISHAHYKLIYTSNNKKKTTFYGKMILERTKEGWKIYSVSEEEVTGAMFNKSSPFLFD
ncbi:hypothetical protein COJ96_25275 [Bacillus sp. AFS073361]|nr:hypothetical protein COJ96_25275 [Bacillus sp. AFS073361]